MHVKDRTCTYVIKKAEDGAYIAKCVELPQVHTEGETLAEVKRNMRDALTLAVDYIRERAKKEKDEGLSSRYAEASAHILFGSFLHPRRHHVMPR
jgi:predicted RNase H-like HicB family nuclease